MSDLSTPLISAELGDYQVQVDVALSRLRQENILARIWAHDHTVWKAYSTEITNRLGWLHIAQAMLAKLPRLQALVEEVRSAGFTQVLLLGMGGSSLAPEVFDKVFGARSENPLRGLPLAVLDSTDPGAVLAQAARIDIKKTLFIVATKSGGTVETLSFFKFFFNRALETMDRETAGQHFIAITDPGSKLEQLAKDYQFRHTFLNDPNIGGRYSVLSYFGMVPAALVGVDIEKLLHRALQIAQRSQTSTGADEPCSQLGVILGQLANPDSQHGKPPFKRDKVTFLISPAISPFGDWVEQLVAESTGKEGKGILPVVNEPVGSPELYGDDRLFVYLQMAGDDTFDAAMGALQAAGHPVIRIQLEDRYDLGGQFFLWELATAIASHLLDINPFDQPNVESAKALAREAVKTFGEKGQLPADEPAPLNAETLKNFLAQARPGDYFALQAYLQPTPEIDQALLALRTKLRDHFQLATSVGYGPRFLHSTGQLHKGDNGNGLFIQFTSDASQDADIPDIAGKPSSTMSFGVLKMAQALGDAQALRGEGRRVIRFHLKSNLAQSLQQAAEWV